MLNDYSIDWTNILGQITARPFTSTFVVLVSVTIVIPWVLRILRRRTSDPLKQYKSGVIGWLILACLVADMVSSISQNDYTYLRPDFISGCCCGALLPVAWIASNYPSAVEFRKNMGVEFIDYGKITAEIQEEE